MNDLKARVNKTFRVEVKEVEDEGRISMVIPMSTGATDRDGEIIEPFAFKKSLKEFMKRPILLSSHNYMDLTSQIGEFESLKATNDGLMAKSLKYYINEGNEQADWGFNLAKKGMAAFSVGFIPIKWEKIDEKAESEWHNRKYTEVELLEVSQVVVPSNREAIQGLRSKGVNDPVVDILLNELENEVSDTEAVVLKEAVKLSSDTDKEFVKLVTKPEETDEWIHIPVKGEAGKHKDHRIRTIQIDKDKGISAKYCGECKKNISFMFKKSEGWTMASAQAWVDDHKSFKIKEDIIGKLFFINESLIIEEDEDEVINAKKPISQQELIDELDYVKSLIEQVGLSVDAMSSAMELANEINMRSTGADIPDDIEPPSIEAEKLVVSREDIASITVQVMNQLKGKVS